MIIIMFFLQLKLTVQTFIHTRHILIRNDLTIEFHMKKKWTIISHRTMSFDGSNIPQKLHGSLFSLLVSLLTTKEMKMNLDARER